MKYGGGRGISMDQLDEEIAAYQEMRGGLEADHLGKWVVVHNRELVGTYENFQDAALDAISKFGRGPYLIREVGKTEPVPMPASLLFGL